MGTCRCYFAFNHNAISRFHFPQVVVEGQQFGFDAFQALYHLKLLRHSVAVTPNKGLRSIQFQPFLFHQKVYHFYGFYVFRRVEPGVFLIPHGLDDGEFFFPKSKRGSGDVQDARHIAYPIISLA